MTDKPTVAVSEDFLKVMEKRLRGLENLMEISTIISSTLDLKELMSLVMEKAKTVMEAEACSILFYNKDTNKLEFEVAMCNEEPASDVLKEKVTLDMGQGVAGWVAKNLKPLFIEDAKSDSRFYDEADRLTGFTTKSLIAVPLIGRSGLIGVAEMLNPKRTDYDLEIFQLLSRQFALAIENARFYKESVERERLKQELDIASALQKSFLPESPVFRKGDLTISAVNISAAKVGGDIYDFIGPVDNKVGVLIGDVSGKGVSAALYMAKIITDFRYVAHHLDPPDVILNRLNSLLSKSPRGMFLTAIYMIADTASGQVIVSSAGHPPLLWLRKDGLEVMSVPSGPPAGIIPFSYPSARISLEKGDRLLLLTDGVFDAKDREGNRLGFENFVRFIKGHTDKKQLLDVIVDYVEDFSAGVEKADDLTIVELRWGD